MYKVTKTFNKYEPLPKQSQHNQIFKSHY